MTGTYDKSKKPATDFFVGKSNKQGGIKYKYLDKIPVSQIIALELNFWVKV